ncbi:hypothetical protein Taro_001044 [Colocasia esculenta]|uniref:Uncharacterized protein n=1 Tax=Colocasia esculenta TaxID=4460 RepID=A0A843TGZ9_COLES|nr:hypothetical protein [Colocasia esculenta]
MLMHMSSMHRTCRRVLKKQFFCKRYGLFSGRMMAVSTCVADSNIDCRQQQVNDNIDCRQQQVNDNIPTINFR